MNDVKTLLGQRIKELRKSRNISQQELAEKINIDQRNLSNIETGRSFPSKSLLDIADALQVRLPELFEFEHISITNSYKLEYINSHIKMLTDEKLNFIYKLVKSIQE